MKRIEVGDQWTFDDDSIFNIQYTNTVDVTGAELTIDTLEVRVVSPVGGTQLLSYDGFNLEASGGEILCSSDESGDPAISDATYATPVLYYKDNVLIGKYFVSSITREQRDIYVIHAISTIGLMSRRWCEPKLFAHVSLASALTHIIGASGSQYTYSISSELSDLCIDGFIPRSTQRVALHQLMFAYDVHITKDANCNMVFGAGHTDSVGVIPANRTYLNGTVNYESPISKVVVVGYGIADGVPDYQTGAQVVYETSELEPSTQRTIYFDHPVYVDDYYATGSLEIVSISAESAVVSGAGTLLAYYCVINAFAVTKVIDASSDNELRIENNTLITHCNIDNVADRLLAYASRKKTVEGDIVLDDEKVGETYTITDAFEDTSDAFLSKVSVNVSAIDKATCKFISGYTGYADRSKIYSNCDFISYEDGATGTWQIPQSVFQKEHPYIKAVIVGGGTGGQNSTRSYNGRGATRIDAQKDWQPAGIGGRGGLGGKGGAGGKILEVTIDCTGISSLNWSLGSGGNGGDPIYETRFDDGDEGTPTTFGSYSSDDGDLIPTGYIVYNHVTADNKSWYALGSAGVDGVDGFAGGSGGSSTTDNTQNFGENAEDYNAIGYDPDPSEVIFGFSPPYYGKGGNGEIYIKSSTVKFYAGGGGGGGGGGSRYLDPKRRPHGTNGKDAEYISDTSIIVGGTGGHGTLGKPQYSRTEHGYWGRGGNGGNGGGGGGGGGCAMTTSSATNYPARGGQLGTGANTGALFAVAGQGGDYGCIYIFY